MNSLILATEKDMESIDHCLPIRRNSLRPLTIQRRITIEIFQQRLLGGEITCLEYLKNISYSFQTNFPALENFDLLMDTNELEIESQSSELT